ARPDELPAAFELALQYVSAAERPERVAKAQALLKAGELHADGVFVARDGRGLAGVQVVVPLTGANALFWLPQARAEVDGGTLAAGLIQAAIEWLRGLGVKLAQAFPEAEQLGQAGLLLSNGFVHVTRIRYFRHDLIKAPKFELGDLRLEPFQPNRP